MEGWPRYRRYREMGVGSFGSHLEGTSLGTVGPCKGLTPVIPPSREEGVRFHRTSPSPLPPLGLHPHLILWLVGSHLPRGGLGHQVVSRDLTSRDISGGRALHLGDPQASPAGITGTFPAEETEATWPPFPLDWGGPPVGTAATPPGPASKCVNSGR